MNWSIKISASSGENSRDLSTFIDLTKDSDEQPCAGSSKQTTIWGSEVIELTDSEGDEDKKQTDVGPSNLQVMHKVIELTDSDGD